MRLAIRSARSLLEAGCGPRRPEARVRALVEAIIEDVACRGDKALAELATRYDHVPPGRYRLEVEAGEWQAVAVDTTLTAALETAAANILAFHRRTRPHNRRVRLPAGGTVTECWSPVGRVGLYIPGGRAPYPSTVLMTALPARAAGVGEVVACTPPRPDGTVDPLVLAACRLAGVSRVFRAGGAGAIAAMALGTATVPAVDVVAGPGNTYVTEAKRQLFGQVGIDVLAGPSELVVLVGQGAVVDWVAADLAAQAEHGSGAWALAICLSAATAAALSARLEEVATGGPVQVVLAANTAEALELINALAPEHVQLVGPGTRRLARRITNAGAVLVGDHTPAAAGDYAAGPSHVLPTGGSARFAGGLSTRSFMKCTHRLELPPPALGRLVPTIAALARAEGFTWHAQSAGARRGEEGP